MGRLDYRGQGTGVAIFLGVLDELILLEEILKSALLAPHLVLENLDLSLQLDVLFFVSVCCLLQLHDLLLQLLWHLIVLSHYDIGCLRSNNCVLVLSIYMGAIALAGALGLRPAKVGAFVWDLLH